MPRRKRDGNEDLRGMGSRVEDRGTRRNVRQEALILPKNGLQNLLQSVDRNGKMSCCHTRGQIELGMPSWPLFKEKKKSFASQGSWFACSAALCMCRGVSHQCDARAGRLQGRGQACAPVFPHVLCWSGYSENWKMQLSRLQSLR